jgi:hypothetical protein
VVEEGYNHKGTKPQLMGDKSQNPNKSKQIKIPEKEKPKMGTTVFGLLFFP